MTESSEQTPFKLSLEPKPDVVEGQYALIEQFQGDNRWVIKEFSQATDGIYYKYLSDEVDKFRKREVSDTPPPPMTQERFKKDFVKWEKLLKKTKTSLNSYVPEHLLLYAKNAEGKETAFMVMRNIQGKELERITELTDLEESQVAETISVALDFYDESKNTEGSTGQGYMPDIAGATIKNIIVGSYAGESDAPQKAYLIDIYPLIRIKSGDTKAFDYILQAIKGLEKKVGRPLFPAIKQRVEDYKLGAVLSTLELKKAA